MPARGRLLSRWWPSLVVVLVATAAVGSVAALQDTDPEMAAPTPTSSVAPSTTSPPTSSSSAAPAPTTTARSQTDTVALGSGLAPIGVEPCRVPNVADGSAWLLNPVSVNGQAFPASYSCNMFSGSIGSLEFPLGKSFRTLTVTIAFADGPGTTAHRVNFEFIGDGNQYLIPPRTLPFGEVAPLAIDVSGVTRLLVKLTEQSPPGGSGAPSRPVLAGATLTRA